MNPVAELLDIDDVHLDVDVSDKAQLLDRVATLLAARHGLAKAAILEDLAARERLGSTGVGHGVAIPHARTSRCIAPAGVFVRTRSAIAFDAPDGAPVSVFLALIVPDQAIERHLRILATAAAMFSDRIFREKLRSADSPAATWELLSTFEASETAPP
jgi:PTS system nitrogen regulatory IIA component